MGSGACVRMYVYAGGYINLYIDGIIEDQSNTKGLCGNYNGIRDDDSRSRNGASIPCIHGALCHQWSEEWRVSPEDSLFDTHITEVVVNYPLPELCKCIDHESQNIECGPPTTLDTGNHFNLFIIIHFQYLQPSSHGNYTV